ncbi:hypothetical protein ACSBOB_11630 [Mesorhizobium sp. ASY16-5R]|uniref:hypothetical protein n=1 Tax=Mesorhizobium sp. ASY16-5R TaxID=3445772 RepID=UPI003F9FC1F9
MSTTREFLANWLQENVGNLPTESEVSMAVLAQQFEQDADAAGYGYGAREDELGNVENAIAEALKMGSTREHRQTRVAVDETNPAPLMEALEVDDSRSGP